MGVLNAEALGLLGQPILPGLDRGLIGRQAFERVERRLQPVQVLLALLGFRRHPPHVFRLPLGVQGPLELALVLGDEPLARRDR